MAIDISYGVLTVAAERNTLDASYGVLSVAVGRNPTIDISYGVLSVAAGFVTAPEAAPRRRMAGFVN